jgi:predicted transcriptional regulator
MANALTDPVVDDEAAEAAALAAAVAEARADPRAVPHEEMRAWLLRIAAGELDAPPPEPRHL